MSLKHLLVTLSTHALKISKQLKNNTLYAQKMIINYTFKVGAITALPHLMQKKNFIKQIFQMA